MIQLLVRWIISAVLLLVVSQVVPGFHVIGLRSAMIAALVIGLVNATGTRVATYSYDPYGNTTTTGTVTRKMIRSTIITSTSGANRRFTACARFFPPTAFHNDAR